MERLAWTGRALASALTLLPLSAAAATTLPAPYVSRALDAVLMPIDASVRSTFALGKGEAGVLVIALDPEGTGASLGLKPGDVIASVGKKRVQSPIMLDEIVYYWIAQGLFDFGLSVWQDGAVAYVPCTITEAMYLEEISVTSVSTWESWEVSSFSYEAYYSEYSEEISISYGESETVIEESVTSETFAEEMAVEDEGVLDDGAVDDAAMTDDAAPDEAADDASGDDGDPAMDATEDDGTDAADDCSVDDSCGDDAADDGGDMDDSGGDDGGGDEGGDDGGDDSGGDDGGGDDGGGDDEG